MPLDVLVVAAYGLILPPAVLAWPRHGCLNIHASLLPRWRGAAPIQRAIARGRRARPASRSCRWTRGSTPGRCSTSSACRSRRARPPARSTTSSPRPGARAIVASLRRLARDGALAADAAAGGRRDLRAEDRAAPTRPSTGARAAARSTAQVRAFDPAPGACDAARRASRSRSGAREPARRRRAGVPRRARCSATSGDGIVVACGDGALRLAELQPAGGRRMSAAAFAAGRAARARRALRRAPRGVPVDARRRRMQRSAAAGRARRARACSTARRCRPRSPQSRRRRRRRAAAAARSCRSSPTARCGTGARSTRSCARSRRSRSPIPRSRCLVAVALYQLDHTRAPPFAVVDHAVERRGDARAARGEGAGQRAAAPLPARARGARRGGARRPGRALVASALVDRPRASATIPTTGRRSSRPATSGRRSRCASTGASTTRDALLARVRRGRHRRDAGGRGGHHRRRRRGRSRELPGYRRRRVLGAGPGRAARGAAAARRATGMRVLDACAAPGGKTTHLARARRRRARRARQRRGAARARPREPRAPAARRRRACAWSPATPATPAAWWDGRPFDRILADVPCTASGVVRRHPGRQVAAARSRRRELRAAAGAAARRAVAAASRRAGSCSTRPARCSRRKTRRRSRRSSRARRRVARNPHLPARRRRVAAGNSCLRSPARATIRTVSSTRCSASPERARPQRATPPAPTPTVHRHRVRRPARRHASSDSLPHPSCRDFAARAARLARRRVAAARARAGGALRRRRAPTRSRSSRPSCAPTRTTYVLNAEFELALNPTLEEALQKGVPLYFVLEFELAAPALVLARREGAGARRRSTASRTTR